MLTIRALAFTVVTAFLASTAPPTLAQAAWPTKPIRILVGSPPGGPSDIVTRLFAEQLSQRVKQSVVVENRPGVGNSLAAGVVAKGDPDGHTLVVSPDTVVSVNPLVYPKLNFDARTELVNVSVLAAFTQMLVCNAGKGIKTVPELLARSKSTRMNYASGGPGVPGHLAAEMLLQTAGAKMEHVPYKGPAPATLAVLSGEVDCGFLATPTVLPHVKAGKLNALAVSSAEPSPLAPEVPTLAKALNRPDLDISFKLVLQAAKGTPAPVIAELERAAMDIMKRPEVRTRLHASDLFSIGSTSKDAEAQMKAETARWEPVVRRLDIKAE
jgi:tripartite-type tricarboxylate transporter receptor subunit TctC